MKIPGYLLALYIIILAIIPCCAFDDCPEDKSVAGQSTNHEQGDEDCGNCSPFFNCEGCSIATIATEHMQIGIQPILPISLYNTYIDIGLPRTDHDFWQPPKIG